MIITKPNPNESNETLNLNQPNPTLDTISLSQIPNYAQFPNSTTNYGGCQENNQTPVVGKSPIPARRRGRPPGSTNKKPNLSAKDKGKSVLIDEGDQGGAKKRKFDGITDPNPRGEGDYIPEPINGHQFLEPSQLTLNFISNLMVNPNLTEILVQQGVINPNILGLLQNTNNNQNSSPTSIFQGPYSTVSDDEVFGSIEGNHGTENLNIIDITEVENHGLATTDPSGGIEFRGTAAHLAEMGNKEHLESPLLSPASSGNHKE
ncbi:hypothetical protein FRX31_012557, partial [Thalictrum thalictroides]